MFDETKEVINHSEYVYVHVHCTCMHIVKSRSYHTYTFIMMNFCVMLGFSMALYGGHFEYGRTSC